MRTLAVAVEHHKAGRRVEAESAYRRILSGNPNHPDALHLLGVLAAESGNYDAAIGAIGRAARLRPGVAAYHANLGLAYCRKQDWERAAGACRRALAIEPRSAAAWARLGEALGNLRRLEEAVEAYRRAVALDASRAEWFVGLGNAQQLLGSHGEAEENYRRAAELGPDDSETWFQLGNVLFHQERWEEAAAAFARATGVNPSRAELHYNLGNTLAKLGRHGEAVEALREALVRKPDYTEAYNNLGTTLQALGRFTEAEIEYRNAAQSNPGFVDALYNLGFLLQEQDRLEEALAWYDHALARKPDHEESLNNRSNTLLLAGRTDEALQGYESLAGLRPDHAEANWNRGLLRLQTGDWERGWQDYEWRFRQKEHAPRHFDTPRWMGEPIQGKTILVAAEQGLGDTIQFVRFLAPLKRLGCRVVFETQPRLKALLSGVEGIDALIAREEPRPEHDCYSELMSLPARLGTRPETLPAEVPYLRAEPERVEYWRQRMAGPGKRRIGLVWSGNPENKTNRRRSFRLKDLAPLAELAGVSFYGLQRGEAVAELKEAPFPIVNLEEEATQITDTAAMMLNLDLVISVDTVTAHLAGALACPVWLLLPYSADWRWMEEPERTAWYPTMRLFRQAERGDWGGVVRRVTETLLPGGQRKGP